jgi:hypothetical protein
MFDTLFLRPTLHCNTSLHFTTLHPTTLHYTYRHFTSSHLHLFVTSHFFLLRMRCVSDKSRRENENTQFTFNIFFFFKNRVVYEIMWKNIVQPARPQTTIWRIRIACWIPKATNTLSDYVKLVAFPL